MTIDLDFIRRDYDINMPRSFISRLSNTDFSDKGDLVNVDFSSNLVIVHFFTPLSRFCQEFAPEFTKFSKLYGKEMGVLSAAVDLSLPENEILIQRSKQFPYCLGKYYPTIIIYKDGKPCTTYLSFRNADDIKKYISETIISKTCPMEYILCEDSTSSSGNKEGLVYKNIYKNTGDNRNQCKISEDNSSISIVMWIIILLFLCFLVFCIVFGK
jgi:thiol-disulfide isomerase/thioredoxin